MKYRAFVIFFIIASFLYAQSIFDVQSVFAQSAPIGTAAKEEAPAEPQKSAGNASTAQEAEGGAQNQSTSNDRTSNGITSIENFEGSFELGEDRLWQGNAELSNAEAEERGKAVRASGEKNDFGNSTKFAKLSVFEKGTKELFLSRLSVKEPSILSFRYRTELVARFGQQFKIYVDGKESAAPDGVDIGWRVERIALGEGEHNLRFETVNVYGRRVVNGYNAVYIDDITLFPDKIVSIRLRPRGEQRTAIEADGKAKLQFKGEALLADGSVKNVPLDFVYEAQGGSIDKSGLWTSTQAGIFNVRVKFEGLTVRSGNITVYEADFLKRPFTYWGTGKSYSGLLGGERARIAAEIPSRESLVITNPKTADFEADAFFLLEGSVRRPKGRNYARVLVRKVSDSPQTASGTGGTSAAGAQPRAAASTRGQKLETWYIVKDDFARRIWLPFGPGEYRIELIEFDSVSLSAPAKGEGLFRGGTYSLDPIVLTAFNTRAESGIDGDGRWIYPSFNVQSDDFRVVNLLNDLTYDLGAGAAASGAGAAALGAGTAGSAPASRGTASTGGAGGAASGGTAGRGQPAQVPLSTPATLPAPVTLAAPVIRPAPGVIQSAPAGVQPATGTVQSAAGTVQAGGAPAAIKSDVINPERAKIEAVHDGLVSMLSYDGESFYNTSKSRKMDAVSVIANLTGVCDGYSNLSAALLRSAGIPTRIVVNRGIMHSWNHVWTDGAWKFYDATWDDPLPDRGPEIKNHTYLLIDSLSGGDSKHRGQGSVVIGDVE